MLWAWSENVPVTLIFSLDFYCSHFSGVLTRGFLKGEETNLLNFLAYLVYSSTFTQTHG